MGDSKLLDRFHGFCDAYKADFAFEGVVEGFDTVEPVDPEHLTRGMFVNSEKGTKLVLFGSKKRPSVVIGDRVVVVGKEKNRDKDSIYPAVILNLTERLVLFSRDIRPRTRRNMILWNTPAIIVLGILSMSLLIVQLRQVWVYMLTFPVFFLSSLAEPFLLRHTQRPKEYQCDEQTWNLLTEEISTMFDIVVTV